MSWTDVYPVLSDELLEIYQREVSADEREDLDRLLGVAKEFNRQESRHLVATSFCKRPGGTVADFQLAQGEWFGLNYHDYFEFYQLVSGVQFVRSRWPSVVFRIYLAADLDVLVEPLVSAGCEVFLMESGSDPWEAVSTWKFLALEEQDRWVTLTQPSFGHEMDHDVARTEQVMKSELQSWRSPCLVGSSSHRLDARAYRPIHSEHFGSKVRMPAGDLIRALIWHTRRGTMETRCVELEGGFGYPLDGCQWPSNSFPEWFLMVAVFPRIAFEGILTFVIWQRKTITYWYVLDIEYVTWANPASEVLVGEKNVPADQAWSKMPESSGIAVRADTEVFRRERRRIYEGFRRPPPIGETSDFEAFEGNLVALIDWAVSRCGTSWWIDLNPRLGPSPTGAEMFMDDRFEAFDVVACGYVFIRVTEKIAQWALDQGLDTERWRAGSIVKAPKLEGLLTLWRTEFSKEFQARLKSGDGDLRPEILLVALTQQGKAAVENIKASAMGWKAR